MTLTVLMTWEGHLYCVFLLHWARARAPARLFILYALGYTETGVPVHLESCFGVLHLLKFLLGTLYRQLGTRVSKLHAHGGFFVNTGPLS